MQSTLEAIYTGSNLHWRQLHWKQSALEATYTGSNLHWKQPKLEAIYTGSNLHWKQSTLERLVCETSEVRVRVVCRYDFVLLNVNTACKSAPSLLHHHATQRYPVLVLSMHILTRWNPHGWIVAACAPRIAPSRSEGPPSLEWRSCRRQCTC